jgi:hypothetical protein
MGVGAIASGVLPAAHAMPVKAAQNAQRKRKQRKRFMAFVIAEAWCAMSYKRYINA